ncbi:alpha/beta hydrolase [Paenibacillus puldeungensis]|uniref:Alpha/beta hydrolase n=1 Tax=Paenibacillus puldeungensis TaxID=696536 RepID=A0ABW3RSH6_9BACL
MELQIQLQTESAKVKPTFRSKLARRVRGTYRYDTAFWRTAIAGPWGAGMFAFIMLALGMPSGLGVGADVVQYLFVGTMSMFLIANIIAVLFALVGLPVPRLFVGTVIYDAFIIFVIFYFNEVSWTAAMIVAGILTVAGIICGLLAGILTSRKFQMRAKVGALAALMLAAGILVAVDHTESISSSRSVFQTDLTDRDSADELELTIPKLSDNPTKAGPYHVATFQYGSGKNFWQPEYGKDAAVFSMPVDASEYIKKWPQFRKMYWGFDQHTLPLNGRVWMPDSAEASGKQGPFPLVLIVHGNHLMEDYSDDGYGYLGRLLASRGFIAVSVDENFLNYSVWTGIPDNDMKVRAWLLLKHLQQIGQFAKEPGNLFYEKVDFSNIALIGHSRGGQAVAMAADYKDWFGKDAMLDNLEQYHIQSVVAIAPTDKMVDGKLTSLKDVNYLTLQGARDGDVSDFDGDRQYSRTTFSPGSSRFKASLYIADANHSQFNSSWGGRDVSLPKGILLSRKGMLSATEQREIAKLYISAFLEESLHRDEHFLPLMRDYRSGLAWLPVTDYYNRFESGEFGAWARYDEDLNRTTIPGNGKAGGNGLTWKEEEARNRGNSSKSNRGIVLEQSGKTDKAAYSLQWEHGAPLPPAGQANILSFSMADRSFELHDSVASDQAAPVHVDVELVDGKGVSVRLPLSRFMPVVPLPATDFTIHPWFDEHLSDGKYKQPTEVVFQTYRLPLTAFTGGNSRFDPFTGIQKLSFYLNGDSPEKVMLDDIGMY